MDSEETIKKYLDLLSSKRVVVKEEGPKGVRYRVSSKITPRLEVVDKIKDLNFINSLRVEFGDEVTLNTINAVSSCFNFSSIALDWMSTLKTSEEENRENLSEGVAKMFRFKIYVDTRTGEHLFWDPEVKKLVEDLSLEAYRAIVPSKIFYSKKEDGKISPCRKVYNPYTVENFWVENDIIQLNTYKAPKWRAKDYKSKYPEEIKLFLEHLFPIEKEREVIFTFLKYMILHRVSWIFLLLGTKGIGKGIFVDHLCKSLVGSDYFKKVNKGFFDSAFQDVLIDTRLVFFDEMNVKTTDAKNDVKRICNKQQSIEVKGKNTRQYEAYYSAIMANNSYRDIKVESDDRRFFIPKTSETPLSKIFSQKKLEVFVNRLDSDEEFYGQFGAYILDKEDSPDFNTENAYITETFYLAVDSSLSDVEKHVVSTLVLGEEEFYSFTALKNLYQVKGDTRFFSEGKIKEFIKNHTERGNYLGTVEVQDGISGILVNPEIRKGKK